MTRRVLTWATVAISLAMTPCVDTAVAGEKYKGFERSALITVEELKQLMDTKDPKLLVLAVVKPVSYTAGHIPGSINVWLAFGAFMPRPPSC